GRNANSQLGNGTTTQLNVPTVIDAGTSYKAISGGIDHTCGITGKGEVRCWGANYSGQVGNGGTTDARPYPVPVDLGTTYSTISAGQAHTCGITTTGLVKCWGDNGGPQLGDGTNISKNLPVLVASAGERFKSVSAGDLHTCGITQSGAAKCWGSDSNGQLGTVVLAASATPSLVDPGVDYVAISAGYGHTCGITAGGALKCWGYNFYGELGDGTLTNKSTPVMINSTVIYKEISAGGWYTCGITQSGLLRCWGNNANGRLGDGTTTRRTAPVPINSPVTYKKISTGVAHTRGITTSGDLKSWGLNSEGQVGDGTIIQKLSPVVISK
ncbi:MAG: RCC1 domain-containing protein, partial [Bdellovibrionia bacterium]